MDVIRNCDVIAIAAKWVDATLAHPMWPLECIWDGLALGVRSRERQLASKMALCQTKAKTKTSESSSKSSGDKVSVVEFLMKAAPIRNAQQS